MCVIEWVAMMRSRSRGDKKRDLKANGWFLDIFKIHKGPNPQTAKRVSLEFRPFSKWSGMKIYVLIFFRSCRDIEEGWREKQRQRSSRLFGGQILFNSLPR